MGKGNKKRKILLKSPPSSSTHESDGAVAAAPPRVPLVPQPFPSDCNIPPSGFLRNKDPYKASFKTALSTSYEGFAVDENVTSEQAMQHCLENDLAFRKDLTQPFGLGTKCAPTYVTRCLVGDEGTTYKYLGLRMFASPWPLALQQLRQNLAARTATKLEELSMKREGRGAATAIGRSVFDICLVNRMTSEKGLKRETLDGSRTTVSWHADSSLEHYSTIAVYQTIVPADPSISQSAAITDWSVALRVAPNAEGPHVNQQRKKAVEETVVDDTPPIAVSLPTNSAYYLLDDFNHHHQHTVLTSASSKDTVRYSCTFRLLRESHNVAHILERCRKTISQFHRKGYKVYRSEQLLLSEMESEWLRQYYIQGEQPALHASWSEPMRELLQFWNQLERRTYQTVQFLKAAATGRCGVVTATTATKAERKARDRQVRAVATMEELIQRESKSSDLYDSLAGLFEERAKMRTLWAQREKDPAFRDLGYHPIPPPFVFDTEAHSPMPGSPEELQALASELRALWQAYESCSSEYLPTDSVIEPHAKALNWPGWAEHTFGLELQCPWAGAVVQGRKTIETRAYELPPALIGERIAILQSPQGMAGVSTMGNFIQLGETLQASVIGWCKFSSVKKYRNAKDFRKDEKAHLVATDSGFSWKEGETRQIYGWVVGECSSDVEQLADRTTATRRMRSLYQMHKGTKDSTDDVGVSSTSRRGNNRKHSSVGAGRKKTRRF